MSTTSATFALIALALMATIACNADPGVPDNAKAGAGGGTGAAVPPAGADKDQKNPPAANVPAKDSDSSTIVPPNNADGTGATTTLASAAGNGTGVVVLPNTVLNAKTTKSSSSRVEALPAMEFTTNGFAVFVGIIVFGIMGAVLQ